MAKKITTAERADFRLYVQQCSDLQVRAVYDKERAAGRRVYAEIAKEVATERDVYVG